MLQTKTKPAFDNQKVDSYRDDKIALTLSAGCLALVLIAVALTNSFRIMPDVPPIFDPDIYLSMASGANQSLSHVPPFEWRILTPLIVSWLPLPYLKGFFVISSLALFWCGFLCYKICQKLAVPNPLLAVPLFFSFHYACAFLVQNYMIVDPLCLFFILLAFYALYTKQSWLYLLALALGALNKETILAVAIVGLFYRGGWKKWWIISGTIISGAIYLGLRLLIPATDYSLLDVATSILKQRAAGNISLQIFSIILLSFGPVALIIFYEVRQSGNWIWQHRETGLYFLIIVAQLVIASQNARLVVYGLVMIIPLILIKLDLISRQLKKSPLFVFSFAIALQVIFYAALWPYLIWWN